MKHNLGKSVKFYCIFLFTLLFAEDFSYTFQVDKTNPYLKEPVLLTLDLNQTNHDIVVLFQFDLHKNKAYDFQRLNAKITDNHHNTQAHYTYLIHPLKTGDINITFNLVKRATSDAAVSYSFSGDRDDFKKLETIDTPITLPSLSLFVKPLPKDVQLIGEFKLSYRIKTHKAKTYEAIPIQIILQGYGYPPSIKHIIPKTSDFTLFEQTPKIKKISTKSGLKYIATYSLAVSAEKSFDLQELNLHALNPNTHQPYTLKIPKQHFEIEAINKHTLLDKIDSPKPFKVDWSWVISSLNYLLVFLSGYLTALMIKKKKQQKKKQQNVIYEKIVTCKDKRDLLKLLLVTDKVKFTDEIEILENALYRNSSVNLKQLKQNILERV